MSNDVKATNSKTGDVYSIDVKRKDELVDGDITWTWCRRHEERTEHVWTGHKLICLICFPSKRPKEARTKK